MLLKAANTFYATFIELPERPTLPEKVSASQDRALRIAHGSIREKCAWRSVLGAILRRAGPARSGAITSQTRASEVSAAPIQPLQHVLRARSGRRNGAVFSVTPNYVCMSGSGVLIVLRGPVRRIVALNKGAGRRRETAAAAARYGSGRDGGARRTAIPAQLLGGLDTVANGTRAFAFQGASPLLALPPASVFPGLPPARGAIDRLSSFEIIRCSCN